MTLPRASSAAAAALFASALLACSPSILDDCKTTDDCAKGFCEEGYCVERAGADGAAGGTVSDQGNAGGSLAMDAQTPTPDAAPVVPDADAAPSMDTLVPPADATVTDAAVPDAALPDAAAPDAAVPDAARPDAALPDAALPDAALPPGVVGECQNDRTLLPLYAPSGEPCVTFDTQMSWSFEGGYAGRGGGGRAINPDPEDGLAAGAITYDDSPFDLAATFLGSNDLWQGASVRGSVRNSAPMTVEAWIFLPAGSTGGTIVSNIDSCASRSVTGGWNFGVARQDDPLGFYLTLEYWDGVDPGFGGATGVVFNEGILLAPDAWHHVVVTFEGDGQVADRAWAWADGFEQGSVATVNFGPLNQASWLHFGTRANCVIDALSFKIDALRIMNRPLTLDELAASVPIQ